MTDHDNDKDALGTLYHEAYDVLGAADLSTPDQAVTSLSGYASIHGVPIHGGLETTPRRTQ